MNRFFILFLISALFLTGCLGNAAEAECEKKLKSENVKDRIEGARKLGDVATSEALRLLMLHQDDPDYRVKEAVQKSLKKINKRTFLN